MNGVGRSLRSAIVLLMAGLAGVTGCRSLPTGSTALLQLAGDEQPSSMDSVSGRTGGRRAIFGDRAQREDASPNAARLRSEAGYSDNPVQKRVAQRRDGSNIETKAQQIILTKRKDEPEPIDGGDEPEPLHREPDRSLFTGRMEPASLMRFGGSKREPTAPAPSAFDPSSREAEASGDDEDKSQDGGGFVASMFDVFGVGGERSAVKEESLVAEPIQPAGRHQTSVHPLEGTTERGKEAPLDLQTTKSLQSVYWQEDLDKLIALLETQVAQQSPGASIEEQERFIRQHVALRMLYLIASRRPEALQAIPEVPHDRQEFWTQIFWALSSTFDEEAMPDSEVRAAETVAQLRAAIRQMEPRAALQLEQTILCRRIDGFGDYVPFAEDRFEAGQPVLIYTEVNNFFSELMAEGNFRTALRSTITIRQENVNGRTMFQHDLPQSEDRCLSRRRDYFHSYRIQLPDTLQPGPHVLILEVTDTLSGRTGRTTVNFVVE